MYKIVIISSIMFYVFQLLGQESISMKGKYVIDGNFSVINYNGDYYGEHSSLLMGVGLDKYISKYMGIGGRLNFNSLRVENSTASTIFVGPSVSFSIAPFVSSGYESILFLRVSYFFIREKISNSSSGISWGGSSLQYSGGIMSFIFKNVALRGEVGYSFDSYNPPELSKLEGNRFFIILGFSIII